MGLGFVELCTATFMGTLGHFTHKSLKVMQVTQSLDKREKFFVQITEVICFVDTNFRHYI